MGRPVACTGSDSGHILRAHEAYGEPNGHAKVMASFPLAAASRQNGAGRVAPWTRPAHAVAPLRSRCGPAQRAQGPAASPSTRARSQIHRAFHLASTVLRIELLYGQVEKIGRASCRERVEIL